MQRPSKQRQEEGNMLEKINGPKDIKALSWEELDVLGQEIRQFLIEKISATGGHQASIFPLFCLF